MTGYLLYSGPETQGLEMNYDWKGLRYAKYVVYCQEKLRKSWFMSSTIAAVAEQALIITVKVNIMNNSYEAYISFTVTFSYTCG